ncbi:MAG: hypothetical protein QOF38_654 [Pseudonocardiales bacterium]|nr:hypothetical protein [Pseudonocardiales bacterium]
MTTLGASLRQNDPGPGPDRPPSGAPGQERSPAPRSEPPAGVPAVELRVVANSPDEPDRAKWRIEDALGVLAATLERLDVF